MCLSLPFKNTLSFFSCLICTLKICRRDIYGFEKRKNLLRLWKTQTSVYWLSEMSFTIRMGNHDIWTGLVIKIDFGSDIWTIIDCFLNRRNLRSVFKVPIRTIHLGLAKRVDVSGSGRSAWPANPFRVNTNMTCLAKRIWPFNPVKTL